MAARRLLLPGLLLLAAFAHAQAPAWTVAAAINPAQTTSASITRAVAADASGNVFLTGSFTGTVAFGSIVLTSAGATDIFLAKYVPATGTWAWAQRAGGSSLNQDSGNGIAVDGSSIYVTGSFINTITDTNAVTFGNGVPVSGTSATPGSDLFVAKYTDQGSSAALSWVQVAGGSGTDVGNGVAVSGGSVYVAGSIVNTTANANAVVFGGNGTAAGTAPVYGASGTSSADVVLAKYTDQGSAATFNWAQVGGGVSTDQGLGVAVNGSSVYVAGYTFNTAPNAAGVFFGGGGTTPGTVPVNGASATFSADVLVAKYVDNGASAALAWTQTGGGTATDVGQSVAVNGSSVYVVGYLTNTAANANAVVFGGSGATTGTARVNGASSGSSGDLYVAKYTDQGSSAALGWTQVGGGTDADGGVGVAVRGSSVYVAGYFTNSAANANAVVFGGGGTTPGTVSVNGIGSTSSADVVVARYLDNGASASLAWTQVGGSPGYDTCYGLAASAAGLYVGGAANLPTAFGSLALAGTTTSAVSYVAGFGAAALPTRAAGGSPAGLTLFPNPASSGAATLAGATPGATVRVLDALGRVVAAATADASGATQLAGLSAGLYLVQAGSHTARLAVN